MSHLEFVTRDGLAKFIETLGGDEIENFFHQLSVRDFLRSGEA
jgi:hypothetical protein